MDPSPPPQPPLPSRARLEALLKARHAEATADFTRVFGYPPGRWLQLEGMHGTLAACKLLLAPGTEYVTQLTPIWEKQRLHQTVEAVALEMPFAELFTDAERTEARRRLREFRYPGA